MESQKFNFETPNTGPNRPLDSSTATPNSSAPRKISSKRTRILWPSSRRRSLLFLIIYCVFCSFLLVAGWKFYWYWRAEVPILEATRVWDLFYPELNRSGVRRATMLSRDQVLDVVLLGASTIEKGWSDIEQRLQKKLQSELKASVRVFNLATIAHTSRDSALKYSQIADKPIDVVIVYDGFNDCRMNNCPDNQFRSDYTHCAWYSSIQRRSSAGQYILPLDVVREAGEKIGLGNPDINQIQYGRKIKTGPSVRDNLATILKFAKAQGALAVLQTFAFAIPEGYSDEKFRRNQLNYGHRSGSNPCPLEMWGEPDSVRRCVETHNLTIRALAEANSDQVLFIDQNREIPATGEFFIDACHFTEAGCQRFVDNLLPRLIWEIHSRGLIQP